MLNTASCSTPIQSSRCQLPKYPRGSQSVRQQRLAGLSIDRNLSRHPPGSWHGRSQPRPCQNLPPHRATTSPLRVHIYKRAQPHELCSSRHADRCARNFRRPQRSADCREHWKPHRTTCPASRLLRSAHDMKNTTWPLPGGIQGQ